MGSIKGNLDLLPKIIMSCLLLSRFPANVDKQRGIHWICSVLVKILLKCCSDIKKTFDLLL